MAARKKRSHLPPSPGGRKVSALTFRQMEEAPHLAEDFHLSFLQHIHELPLVWRPHSAAGAPQHIMVVFAKPQERV